MVLLAGPSGSGKSHLARLTGLPVLRLDDFYRDGDDPGLPHTLGIVDWDDIGSWNLEAACDAAIQVLRRGRADTPDYSIAHNRAVGRKLLDLDGGAVFLAEGIFAVDTALELATRGVRPHLIWLDRPPMVNFTRRLRRDLAQQRKPPVVLVRRGIALWQHESALRARALAAGFEPMSLPQARLRIERTRAIAT